MNLLPAIVAQWLMSWPLNETSVGSNPDICIFALFRAMFLFIFRLIAVLFFSVIHMFSTRLNMLSSLYSVLWIERK